MRLDLGQLAHFLANVALLLLFVPLVYLTALFILGAFGMQKMVDHVATRSFAAPGAPPRRQHGGQRVERHRRFRRHAAALCHQPAAVADPAAVAGDHRSPILAWVNQRLLRYDALAEHAEAAEMARLFRQRRGPLLLLGFLLALLAYVPLVGFFAPVVFGLAFIRYLLGALEAIRADYRADPNKALARGNAAP